jgi:transcriptional regulator with XRE-family HTH domain
MSTSENKKFPCAFADRVNSLLKLRGINQRKLSEISGLKPPTLNKAMNGHRKLSNENLLKIADALGVSVGYFDGGPLDAVIEPNARRIPRWQNDRYC